MKELLGVLVGIMLSVTLYADHHGAKSSPASDLILQEGIVSANSEIFGEQSPTWAALGVGVEGMVCSFCAQGLKKSFEAQKSVDQVEVDLTKSVVYLSLNADQEISSKSVVQIVKDAGYKVTYIAEKASKE